MERRNASLQMPLSSAIAIFIVFHTTISGLAMSTSSTTDKELHILSEDLLNSDVNNAAHLISVNLQGQVQQGNKKDNAPYSLLRVDPRAWDILTIAKLRLLYNNFEPDVRQPELITNNEAMEENSFLDAILKTPIMEKTHNFLANKGYVSHDLKSFKELLFDIWFGMYPRGKGEPNSSGFEHVFIGELSRGEVGGFHNWVHFYNEEQLQNANYLGYIENKSLGSMGHFVKLTFQWRNNFKAIGSIFIGTSPELEMALYTVCFLTRPNRICKMKLAGHSVAIQTHLREYNGKIYIATAYPADV